MKLSKETIDILKNFYSINDGIVIRPGNKLATVSTDKSIWAEAIVDEYFESEFGIYNVSEFLNAYNISDNGDIYVYPEHLDISWGNNKIKYIHANPEYITNPDEVVIESLMAKNKCDHSTAKKILQDRGFYIDLNKFDVEVEIPSTVLKTASILSTPHLSISGNGSNIKLKTLDVSNNSTNSFELDLDIEYDKKFDAIFDVKNLKLIQGTYRVKLSSRMMSRWENIDRPITYHITMDTKSNFE